MSIRSRRLKEEELIIFENNLDIQFTNQEEAKRIASLAKKYIYSHALEPIENIDVTAPYESIFVNPYAEWVAELNRILKQGDIDSWTQLFKQDVFQEWYSRQDVKNSPEAFLSSYLQKNIPILKDLTIIHGETSIIYVLIIKMAKVKKRYYHSSNVIIILSST
ncbi:hypothetical protein [Lysinibacillus sphaericus]|uniref:hypothetical protein n=1 Tax=Lysinibacillus sphaericus TaxID=1421 RepID=UPI000B170715|nr:hypothetical protein [Lysinibacillus sphaericus]